MPTPPRPLALLALAVAACGGPDAPPPPAPTRTVPGRASLGLLTPAGPARVPDTALLARLEVSAFVGDAFWAFPLARADDGAFEVRELPDVPVLYARHGTVHVDTGARDAVDRYVVVPATDAALDLDAHGQLGRPDAATCDVGVPGTLTVDGGGGPVEAGYQLVSLDTGTTADFVAAGLPNDPARPRDGQWTWAGEDRRCPRAEAGDRSYVLESWTRATDPGTRLRTVTRATGLLPVSLAPPARADLAVTPAALPQATLEVDRPAFLASLREAGVDVTPRAGLPRSWRLALHAVAPAPGGAEGGGTLGPLLLAHEGLLVDRVEAYGYARPLPGPWEEALTLEVSGPFGTVGRRALRARLEAGPLTATLTAPREVTVDGTPTTGATALALTSRTPRVAWRPPARGAPAWYAVSLYESPRDLSQGAPALRAQLLTRDTTLRLPPGLLAHDGYYLLQVAAYAPHAAPANLGARSVERWPELAWASTPSAVLRGPR